jgi:hypothetical protein
MKLSTFAIAVLSMFTHLLPSVCSGSKTREPLQLHAPQRLLRAQKHLALPPKGETRHSACINPVSQSVVESIKQSSTQHICLASSQEQHTAHHQFQQATSRKRTRDLNYTQDAPPGAEDLDAVGAAYIDIPERIANNTHGDARQRVGEHALVGEESPSGSLDDIEGVYGCRPARSRRWSVSPAPPNGMQLSHSFSLSHIQNKS